MELDFNKIIRLKKNSYREIRTFRGRKRLDRPDFERQVPYP